MSTLPSTATLMQRFFCDSLFLFFDTKHHDLCDFLFPGIWQLVFLLPLAAHLVQEGVQFPRYLQLVGGSLDKDVSSNVAYIYNWETTLLAK